MLALTTEPSSLLVYTAAVSAALTTPADGASSASASIEATPSHPILRTVETRFAPIVGSIDWSPPLERITLGLM